MKILRRLQFSCCAAALTVLSLAAGCALAQEAAPETAKPAALTNSTTAPDPNFQSRISRYKIAPGDTFDLNFELSPEFNQTAVAVQPDGFVTLRGVGDIKVQGETVPQLTETLRGAYSKILNAPIISVVLKDFEKPYFVADGQVGKPGKYDLRGDVTLTQAIAIAGGFTDASRHSQVLLFRRVSDEWMEAKIIDVKKMQKAGNLKEDPMLHPGDMLFVPKNTMSKIDKFFPSASMGSFFPIP
ncbi:MAG TPA: polysaccharide biosynthesis/export family protein [Candidatus Sulfotelmatobacter sp.]